MGVLVNIKITITNPARTRRSPIVGLLGVNRLESWPTIMLTSGGLVDELKIRHNIGYIGHLST